jgi:hypothetical protein
LQIYWEDPYLNHLGIQGDPGPVIEAARKVAEEETDAEVLRNFADAVLWRYAAGSPEEVFGMAHAVLGRRPEWTGRRRYERGARGILETGMPLEVSAEGLAFSLGRVFGALYLATGHEGGRRRIREAAESVGTDRFSETFFGAAVGLAWEDSGVFAEERRVRLVEWAAEVEPVEAAAGYVEARLCFEARRFSAAALRLLERLCEALEAGGTDAGGIEAEPRWRPSPLGVAKLAASVGEAVTAKQSEGDRKRAGRCVESLLGIRECVNALVSAWAEEERGEGSGA